MIWCLGTSCGVGQFAARVVHPFGRLGRHTWSGEASQELVHVTTMIRWNTRDTSTLVQRALALANEELSAVISACRTEAAKPGGDDVMHDFANRVRNQCLIGECTKVVEWSQN